MKNIKRIINEAIDEVSFSKKFKEITDFDDPNFADDAEWDYNDGVEYEKQPIESNKTSRNQVPKTFTKDFGIQYVSGTLNFDIGGGAYDKGTNAMKDNFGVENVIFDPYCRDIDFNNKSMDRLEQNGGADSVTVNNCLNVIKGRKFIENVIKQAGECLKKDGHAIFLIYTRDGSGNGIETRDGFQQSKRANKYVPLIKKYFNRIHFNNASDCIIASDPIISFEDRAEFKPDKDGEPRFLNRDNFVNENMKRNIIRLTEGDLHRIIKNSVNRILNEVNGKPIDFIPNTDNDAPTASDLQTHAAQMNGTDFDPIGGPELTPAEQIKAQFHTHSSAPEDDDTIFSHHEPTDRVKELQRMLDNHEISLKDYRREIQELQFNDEATKVVGSKRKKDFFEPMVTPKLKNEEDIRAFCRKKGISPNAAEMYIKKGLKVSDLEKMVVNENIAREGHNGHSKGSGIPFRKIYKILRRNGFSIIRTDGDHVYFSDASGRRKFPMTKPYVNEMIWRRVVKENDIDVNA